MSSFDERLEILQAKLPNEQRMTKFKLNEVKKVKDQIPHRRLIYKFIKQQQGLCKCCQEPLAKDNKFNHVDYCREYNLTRGVICNACNEIIKVLPAYEDRLDKALKHMRDFRILHTGIKSKRERLG